MLDCATSGVEKSGNSPLFFFFFLHWQTELRIINVNEGFTVNVFRTTELGGAANYRLARAWLFLSHGSIARLKKNLVQILFPPTRDCVIERFCLASPFTYSRKNLTTKQEYVYFLSFPSSLSLSLSSISSKLEERGRGGIPK